MSKRQDQDDKNTPTDASTSADETPQSPASSETHKADADGEVADEARGASDKAADAASSKASTTDAAASQTSSDATSKADEKTDDASRKASETTSGAGASSATAKRGAKSQQKATDTPAKDTGKTRTGGTRSSSAGGASAGAASHDKTTSSKAGGAGNGTSPPSAQTSQGGGGNGRGLAIVALIIAVIVAIVVALGLGYGWKRLQSQQAELASAGEENAQTLDTLRERLDQRETAFESLQGDFQDYRQDIDKNLDKVLSELADEQEADPREWLHAEAEYLLRLANQRLQLERDVKGAKALLKAADERLTDADNPALIPVRRAIQSELAALDSVPTVDRTGLYLALMAQQEQLAGLPLKQDVEEMAAQNDDDSSLEGGWQQQLSRLGGELKDLVVIRRHDEALEALVTPEQESYLRQNVRLLLEQAQLALLKTEPKLYQASLDKAITLIDRYYDTKQDAVNNSLGRLESLRDKTIRPELPDISESQQTLKDFIEKRFQNGNDDGGGEQRQNDEGDSA
ncbi:uroporphyrinogen-III C-methyltransferase [Chromohalobacter canadensis]|uniref:uroporphyrinogen-III C-methyltransferase n=1 Tax=Chromohalobacter canadensis TaxID=141389 RepID=UPI0021C1483B|nr:uroporphyrinogen-III C-methyltransferase [Chromohalobacter canadensis]MCT8469248.1 uroporphyrinogen-III C-methyltransferase [Chromohalobacter canadensis]MCT8472562.1 uroporphyrinogen-III C-methyltransferase [Chromohalobacter canadensis]MCT8500015.1 uroporphyrinogen-III C-methyltransferase [Chromohalobacter canadensis]